MQEYDLPNGDQRVQFTGQMLGKRSSRQGDHDLRWTEIEMYKTQAGKYIVHKVGRSVVFHRANQACSSGTSTRNLSLLNDRVPCPRCNPDQIQMLGTTNPALIETDRHTVHVSDTAAGAVESCYTQDKDRVAYLTYPARQLLAEVAQNDTSVHQAFMVQRVD